MTNRQRWALGIGVSLIGWEVLSSLTLVYVLPWLPRVIPSVRAFHFTTQPDPVLCIAQLLLGPPLTPFTAWLVKVSLAIGAVAILLFWAAVARASSQWRLRSRLSTRSQDDRPPPIELANTDNLGHASMMSERRARQLFPHTTGKLIGALSDGPLLDGIDNTSGVSLEFVGTRMGKSSRAASMCFYWPDALAVFDPAAELAHMTWRMLLGKGRRVCIMNPEREPRDNDDNIYSWAPLIGCTNVVGWIRTDDPLAAMHIHTITSQFFDDEGMQKSQSGEFFANSAEGLIATLLAHVLWDEGMEDEQGNQIPPMPRDLISVREYINLTGDELRAALQAIRARSPSSLARRYAGALCGAHPETFGDIHSTAEIATRWLAIDSLAEMVCGDDFDLTDISTDPNLAVFVQVPMTACRSFPSLPRVIFGTLMHAKVLNPGTTHALVITDESWMLKVRAVREIVLNGGKYGVALHMFWQSVGDLDRVWGRDTRKSFFDSAAWVAMGPLGDIDAAKEVSEACGHRGAIAWSKGDNSSVQAGSSLWSRWSRGNSTNRHPVKRPLYYPHEIMQDLTRDERLILRLPQPLLVAAAPWFKLRELAGLIDESPYTRTRIAA